MLQFFTALGVVWILLALLGCIWVLASAVAGRRARQSDPIHALGPVRSHRVVRREWDDDDE